MSTVIYDSAHVGGVPIHLKISSGYDKTHAVSSHRSLCDFRSQEASMREAILPHFSTFFAYICFKNQMGKSRTNCLTYRLRPYRIYKSEKKRYGLKA
jgi:hypothetical protein